MIDAGTHRARAIDGALGYTGTGKEQVAVEFELLDQEGVTITWYGFFTDKTTSLTLKALRACGWTGDDLSDLVGLGSAEVMLVVEHEEDQGGRTRAKVRWVNSAGGLAMKNQMKGDEAKAFAAKMKGQVLALGKAEPRPMPRPADSPSDDRPSPAEDIDEDIGF